MNNKNGMIEKQLEIEFPGAMNKPCIMGLARVCRRKELAGEKVPAKVILDFKKQDGTWLRIYYKGRNWITCFGTRDYSVSFWKKPDCFYMLYNLEAIMKINEPIKFVDYAIRRRYIGGSLEEIFTTYHE